jgi:hypothetical protein
MPLDSVPAYSSFRCGDLGFAYNEAAFRHFLRIERRRAERSNRQLLLILVKARIQGGARPPLAEREASQVFKALGSSVREVDFVGWHREGKVAGAVVALNSAAAEDVVRRLTSRVERVLKAEMAPVQTARVRIRVVRLGGGIRH